MYFESKALMSCVTIATVFALFINYISYDVVHLHLHHTKCAFPLYAHSLYYAHALLLVCRAPVNVPIGMYLGHQCGGGCHGWTPYAWLCMQKWMCMHHVHVYAHSVPKSRINMMRVRRLGKSIAEKAQRPCQPVQGFKHKPRINLMWVRCLGKTIAEASSSSPGIPA